MTANVSPSCSAERSTPEITAPNAADRRSTEMRPLFCAMFPLSSEEYSTFPRVAAVPETGKALARGPRTQPFRCTPVTFKYGMLRRRR